jgi:hypothetical protein
MVTALFTCFAFLRSRALYTARRICYACVRKFLLTLNASQTFYGVHFPQNSSNFDLDFVCWRANNGISACKLENSQSAQEYLKETMYKKSFRMHVSDRSCDRKWFKTLTSTSDCQVLCTGRTFKRPNGYSYDQNVYRPFTASRVHLTDLWYHFRPVTALKPQVVISLLFRQ